jgi:nitrous oxidase accessory protein NosD
MLASFTLAVQGSGQADQTAKVDLKKMTATVSVKEFGAVGDGSTNDTASLQAALDSGATTIYIPEGQYLTDFLTVPKNIKRIVGDGELIQRTLYGCEGCVEHPFRRGPLGEGGLLNIVDANGLVIEGLQFSGIPVSCPPGPSCPILGAKSPIYVLSSSHVTVRSNRFTGWQANAVYVQNSAHLNVFDNLIYGVSGGIRFTGVQHGIIANNTVRDTQLPATQFTVAIGLDSTDGHSFGICRHIVINDNIVKSYVNAQALLVHAGEFVTIVDNVLDDVLIGISLNPFNLADTLSHAVVADNLYIGTSTPGARPGEGNVGIGVGGGPPEQAFIPDHINIHRNIIQNANAVERQYSQGGIAVGFSDTVTVSDNIITDSFAAGIALNNPNTRLVIENNLIMHISVASDGSTSTGMYVSPGSRPEGNNMQEGVVSGNLIDDVAWGIRADVYTPTLLIACDNIFTNYSIKFVNPQNLTIECE